MPRESAGIEENPGSSHNEKTKSQHVSDNDDNNEEFEFKVQSNTPQSIDNANGAREDEQVEVQLHDENVSDVCGDISKLATWKRGQRFRGIDSNTGEPISGKILSRAGKATGAYRNCYNIEKDTDGSKDWYNFEKLRDLVAVPDHEEMLILYNDDAVVMAKEKEIQNWKDNDVYEEVDDVGQKITTSRWVITEKVKDGIAQIKARLVARGFEEDTDGLRKDSPTCSKETVRILFAIAASRGWICHTEDVKAAYLQGNKIKREVFLKPPHDFYNGTLWKLNKTVYGLCDAARAWYLRVKEELLRSGAKLCPFDNSLFVWYNEGRLEGIICTYVDNFLWTGTKNFETNIIQGIRSKFLIGSSGSSMFKYVGLNVISKNDSIVVDQFHYSSSLSPVKISDTRAMQKTYDLSDHEKSEYRGLVGQLNWLAIHTRPDIAYDTCELSVCFNKATVGDLLRLNKLVERVTRDGLRLRFSRLNSLETCIIVFYTDAAFANLPGGGSQGAFIIFLMDSSGKRCPIF